MVLRLAQPPSRDHSSTTTLSLLFPPQTRAHSCILELPCACGQCKGRKCLSPWAFVLLPPHRTGALGGLLLAIWIHARYTVAEIMYQEDHSFAIGINFFNTNWAPAVQQGPWNKQNTILTLEARLYLSIIIDIIKHSACYNQHSSLQRNPIKIDNTTSITHHP
jgi:hypothetical protein